MLPGSEYWLCCELSGTWVIPSLEPPTRTKCRGDVSLNTCRSSDWIAGTGVIPLTLRRAQGEIFPHWRLSKQLKIMNAPSNFWSLIFIWILICACCENLSWRERFAFGVRTTRGHRSVHTHQLVQPSQKLTASSKVMRSSKTPGMCPSRSLDTQDLP